MFVVLSSRGFVAVISGGVSRGFSVICSRSLCSSVVFSGSVLSSVLSIGVSFSVVIGVSSAVSVWIGSLICWAVKGKMPELITSSALDSWGIFPGVSGFVALTAYFLLVVVDNTAPFAAYLKRVRDRLRGKNNSY